MKQKLFFVFIFICTTLNISNARDSTLVFKVAVGINVSKWTLPERNTIDRHNGHSSSYSGDSVFKNDIYSSP
ncbi:MAG: hypothetical protein H0W84_12020, partial [Bacteroidetes bacterium]|nr:hypothetical protein [Bacteroidota bacterium]